MVPVLVIATFVAFILAAVLYQWAYRGQRASTGAAAAPGPRVPEAAGSPPLPEGIFIDSGHTWLGLEPAGAVRLGMDGFAGRALGRIDGIDLPRTGTRILRGDPLFTIRQGGRTAAFSSPMDGEVASVNQDLAREPGTAGADPYGRGWICCLKPENLAKNLRQLRVADEAMEWIAGEVRRFQEFIAGRPLAAAAARALPDGGQPLPGVLETMDEETWNRFLREFLIR